MRKNNKARGVLCPDFKLYYKAILIKQYGTRKRHIGQWNTVESPEVNPCVYGQLIFYKMPKNPQWGKDSLFKKVVPGKLDIDMQKNGLDLYCTTLIKINSQWIKDLNIRPKTLKLPEKT